MIPFMRHHREMDLGVLRDVSFIKHRDRGAQWIYHDTIHNRCREMGLGTLKDVSL